MRRRSNLILKAVIIINCLTLAYPGLSNLKGASFQNRDSSLIKKAVTITGVGDMMFGSLFPKPGFLPPGNNPRRLIETLIDTLRASDITFGNLEGSFLNEGEPVKKCRDTTICYLFRMPEKYSGLIAQAGFDIISLANNHFGDFGWKAALRTKKLLDSLSINYAGLTEHPYSIFTKDSLKYGFCAFSPTAGSTNLNDIAEAEAIVKKLSAECDIDIVSIHGGAEGSSFQRVPKTMEIFYGETRGNVYEFAHRMIDCGADIIFGHGPHVTRAIEVYKDRFISYSLGNFCTYGLFNIQGPNGFAPIIKLMVDNAGRFLSGRIIPVYQGKDGIVRWDSQERVIKKIKELVALDFPGSNITVSDSGNISYK
jgi:poly-gamma-glutamate capsule biosynthesis protein CapA/YwtB (metallophosphatase superfamily)